MGTLSMPLEFTNLSGHTCTLRGLPRVSAIGKNGSPLGSPAAPDRAGREQTVRLAPGQTGYSVLGYSDVMTGNCPPAGRATAFELRVFSTKRAPRRSRPMGFRHLLGLGLLGIHEGVRDRTGHR